MAKEDIQTTIGLDPDRFNKGLNSITSSVKGIKSKMDSLGNAIVGIGLKAFADKALDTAKEVKNLSAVAGLGVEEFQAYAEGADKVSISQEKLADILKDVNDKFGDFFATGAGPLKDFFEKIAPKVGITADHFRDLSSKDALQLYVKTLEEANVNQQDMTFFMEAIASDATALLPLLLNNAQAWKKYAEEAKNAGIIMKKETVNTLVLAREELNRTGKQLTVFIAKGLAKLRSFAEGIGYEIGGMVFGLENMFEAQRKAKETTEELDKSLDKAIKTTSNYTHKQEMNEKALKRVADAQKLVNDAIEDIQEEQAFKQLQSNEKIARLKEKILDLGKQFVVTTDKTVEGNRKRLKLLIEAKRLNKDLIRLMDQALDKQKQQAENEAIVKKLLENEKNRLIFEELTTKEKIADIEKRMIEARDKANKGDVDAANKLIELNRERLRLIDQINEKKKKVESEKTEQDGGGRRRKATVTTFEDVTRESELNRLAAQQGLSDFEKDEKLSTPSSKKKASSKQTKDKRSMEEKQSKMMQKLIRHIEAIDNRTEKLDKAIT